MTLVTGTVQDLGYDGMEGTLWARPARFRSDGQVVYAPERKPFKITGGVVSAELAPGPAVLELQVGSHARGTFEVVIPEEDTTLADLLDTVFVWEPAQISLFVAEREAAEQAKADAEAAAGQATTAAQQTGQDRAHVDQVRTEIEQAYDASEAGQALPPRLTEAALNATYESQARAEARSLLITPQAAIADNAAAVQAAIDEASATGAVLDVRGDITVQSPLAMKSDVKMVGAGRRATNLRSSGCSLWQWQGHLARHVEIESMTMRASGGHIVNLESDTRDTTVKHLTMTNIELLTQSDDASIWRQRDQGQAISVTYKDCVMFRRPTSTVPAWDVVVDGALFNSIEWEGGEAHSQKCTSSPFWRIENTSGVNYIAGLGWKNVVTEQSLGGVIHLAACMAFSIVNVVEWDTAGDTYTGDLFKFSSSGNAGCIGGAVTSSYRLGGTLGEGVSDFNTDDANNRSIVIQSPSATGSGAVIKKGRDTTVIGHRDGTEYVSFSRGTLAASNQTGGAGLRARFYGGNGAALCAELTNSTVDLPNARVYEYTSPNRKAHEFEYMDANGEVYSGNGTQAPVAGRRIGRVANLPAASSAWAGHICRVGDGVAADTLHICTYNGSGWEWRTI